MMISKIEGRTEQEMAEEPKCMQDVTQYNIICIICRRVMKFERTPSQL